MAGTSSSSSSRRSTMITGINVTPLVDVVLVLLVVLMVASTYIVAKSMKVELPRAATNDGISDSPIVLSILRDGQLRLNDEPTTDREVRAKLVEALRNDGELPVVISADKQVPHGRVVEFVDMARVAGAKRFAIKVEDAP